MPFVAATFDGRTDDAVALLRAAEERHGVEILLDKSEIIPAGTFRPRVGFGPTGSDWLDVMAKPDKFSLHFELLEDDGKDEECTRQLHGLLRDTQLLVQGMDFTNEHFVRTRDGIICAWTQRAWGEELAQCANEGRWGARNSWRYTDFYCNAHLFVEQYDSWCTQVLGVIALKCERFALLSP